MNLTRKRTAVIAFGLFAIGIGLAPVSALANPDVGRNWTSVSDFAGCRSRNRRRQPAAH